MKKSNYRIYQTGDYTCIICYDAELSKDLAFQIHTTRKHIRKFFKDSLLEMIPGYNSLSMELKPFTLMENFIPQLHEILDLPLPKQEHHPKTHTLPVCYEKAFAPDIQEVANFAQLSIEELIDYHSRTHYLVYMLGFLPGFAYLGGLHEKLYCPRKRSPRLRTPEGSVGIGGYQTGIYPVESPGGWNIIGRCPIRLFKPESSPPCLIEPLDQIKFKPISAEEYSEIEKEGKRNIINRLHTEPESEPESEFESKAEPELESEAESEVESEPESETESEVESEFESEPESEAESDPEDFLKMNPKKKP